MKANRAGYRERWIDAVLRTDELNPSCKLVCIALSRHMSDDGRVRHPREAVALALGWKTIQRVSDRIKEAKDAHFLYPAGGGINGTVAAYDAMIPLSATSSRGTSSTGRGNGSRGTRNGVPETGDKAAPATPSRGAIRARVSKNNREQEPAPDGSREEREHDVSSQTGTYGSWLPAPSNRLSSDTAGEVA